MVLLEPDGGDVSHKAIWVWREAGSDNRIRSFLHLRRILAGYAGYYNELRTHLSLGKDSPRRRQVQRLGQLSAQPILGGLHHQYCRM